MKFLRTGNFIAQAETKGSINLVWEGINGNQSISMIHFADGYNVIDLDRIA